MIGKTISHYRVIEKLGSGGMGVVYKAEDLTLKRTVALKFLPPELTRDDDAKQRFVAEAQAASSIDHPNICTIHEIGDGPDGQVFIAMSYYGGESLKKLIAHGPLVVEEAIRIATEAAQGLAKAHATGIVHRDVKPANIVMSDDGRVKIVDFGLAKLAGQSRTTSTGKTMGTIAYMSPEQALGESVDARTDIWSLGVVLHEMLVGELPFKGDHEQALVYNILNKDAVRVGDARPDVPAELERIVERAMEKRPARRYASMEQLVAALQEVSRRMASGELRRRRLPFRLRRRQSRLVAAAVLLLAVGGGLLAWRLSANAKAPVTIAVFPITSLGGDASDDRFAEGITDGLYTDLLKIRRLRVASMGPVRRLAGSDAPLPSIGKELHVTWVVDGTAARDKATNQVLIRVRLSNTATSQTVWTQEYTPGLIDVFAVQREIARAIAAEVHVEVAATVTAPPQVPATPEANDEYQRARFAAAKLTPAQLELSVSHFRKAIDLEPRFAPAYAGLAGSYELEGGDSFGVLTPSESAERAVAAARQALAIDKTLAEAHRVLGQVKRDYDWNLAGADAEFDLALSSAPDDPGTLREQAWLRLLQGRDSEALALSLQVRELDALDLGAAARVGLIYGIQHRTREGLDVLREVLDFNPSFAPALMARGVLLSRAGAWQEAIASYEEALSKSPGSPELSARLAYAYARAGRTAEAGKIQAALDEKAKSAYVPPVARALVAAALGESEAALDWLEKASIGRSRSILELGFSPEWDELRTAPRFAALLGKVEAAKR